MLSQLKCIKPPYYYCINYIITKYKNLPEEKITELWFDNANLKGKNVSILENGNKVSGLVDSISDIGALYIISKDNNKIKILTGDICYND